MRNFVASSREITPSNRIGLLNDALIHYADRAMMNIGTVMSNNNYDMYVNYRYKSNKMLII